MLEGARDGGKETQVVEVGWIRGGLSVEEGAHSRDNQTVRHGYRVVHVLVYMGWPTLLQIVELCACIYKDRD